MQHLPDGQATPIPGKAGDLLIVSLQQAIGMIIRQTPMRVDIALTELKCVCLGCV